MKSTLCTVALAAVATLTLASCGGGGGSPTTSEQPPPPEVGDQDQVPDPMPEVPGSDDATGQMPDDDLMEPPPPPTPGLATLTESLETYNNYTSTSLAIVGGDIVEVPRTYIDIGNWGYSATAANGTQLFTATSQASGSITNGEPDYQSYFSSVIGSWSFSNPVEAGGLATWAGGVRGISDDYRRVEGKSSIRYHFGANLVDVTFDQFDDGRAAMQWLALPVLIGGFSYGLQLDGNFYGTNHEGVAGKFDRDDLRGVFGAVRQ